MNVHLGVSSVEGSFTDGPSANFSTNDQQLSTEQGLLCSLVRFGCFSQYLGTPRVALRGLMGSSELAMEQTGTLQAQSCGDSWAGAL